MSFNSLIRAYIRRDPVRFHSLRANMTSARMPLTLERYLERVVSVSVVAGLALSVATAIIIWLAETVQFSEKIGIYSVLPIPFPDVVLGIPSTAIFKAFVTVLAFLLGFFIVYTIGIRVPALRRQNRAVRINLSLHNAVAYMFAMQRGGAQMMVIFRAISENAFIYGEVALEFRQVVRDADIFGYDVISALHHLMETTPSRKMKEFLEDLISIIESGGDLVSFLSGRVRMYQDEARFEQKEFLNFLSLIAEAYVTVFVAGPLFLIIIMVVMGLMGGAAIMQMSLVAYAFLPIGSAIFIVLIDMVTPGVEGIRRYVQKKRLREYQEVRLRSDPRDDFFFARLARYDRVRNFREFLRHPIRGMVKDYHRTLYITVPLAGIYLLLVLLYAPPLINPELYIDVVDDQVLIALLIVLVPYAVFYELWRYQVRGIESLIPDFLERLAGINQVGLTIAQAIAILVNTNLGLLSYEIKRIKRDMDWGANFSAALMRFEQRVSTPLIARTVTLITKASEMSGAIHEVLTIASSDARMSEILKKERLSEMFVYTAIVYLAFFVFIFVIGVLSSQFLPMLSQINTGNLPAAGALAGLKSISVKSFERLMYHTCIIQALFSGIIAGQMGESSVSAGIKHSGIMLFVALIVFNFVI